MDFKLDPKLPIINRGKFFRARNYIAFHALYSDRSDFRQFFPDPSDFAEHMQSSSNKDICYMGTIIIKARMREKLSEVVYEETFRDGNGNITVYAATTTLVFEGDEWKILKENRIVK